MLVCEVISRIGDAVGQKVAILVGVEQSAGLEACLHAPGEVVQLASAFEKMGVPKANITTLTEAAATKSAIESRLRKLTANRTADDELWFVFVGPAIVADDQTLLACADTLEDDREATALVLRDVFQQLHTSGAAVRLLLDAPDANADELGDLLHDTPHVALFAGTTSHVAGGRRLWLRLIGEALQGLAPSALAGDTLTTGALQAWLQAELPRAIRKGASTPKPQKPELIGSPDTVLATISAKATKPTAKLDMKQLKRVVFRGEVAAPVKSLLGFQKNFRLPESASPSAQKMVNRMATDDLKADIETRFNDIREHLGIKRKDLEASIGSDGLAFIRTPSFDYIVSVSINPDDPTTILWRREVCQITNADMLRTPGFRTVFGAFLDSLQFDFEKPVDVEELVDRIEDDPPPGVKVRVAADGSRCDVTVQGFAGSIHVERATLRINGRPGQSPDSLVEQFFAFHTQFGNKKGLPALRDRSDKRSK